MERTRWYYILVDKISNGQAQKIAFKVPVDVKECKGFQFSANVPGLAAKRFELGNISLFTNNRKAHALHHTIRSKPAKKGKYKTLKLNETLEGGSWLYGYYVDLAAASSYPYKVKVYLECTLHG